LLTEVLSLIALKQGFKVISANHASGTRLAGYGSVPNVVDNDNLSNANWFSPLISQSE
jgi:hypothetical protein